MAEMCGESSLQKLGDSEATSREQPQQLDQSNNKNLPSVSQLEMHKQSEEQGAFSEDGKVLHMRRFIKGQAGGKKGRAGGNYKETQLNGKLDAYQKKVTNLVNQTEVKGSASLLAISARPGVDKDAKVREKMRLITNRTKYPFNDTAGNRKYGPPPNWTHEEPSNACEVFCGNIPRDYYEDELIPVMEKRGVLYVVRLMTSLMDDHLGHAFIKFSTPGEALLAVRIGNREQIRGGRNLKLYIPYLRLLVHNIPQSKTQAEIEAEFKKNTDGLVKAHISPDSDDGRLNAGFCILEFSSEDAVNRAKETFKTSVRVTFFGLKISAYSDDPHQVETDDEAVPQVIVDAFILQLPDADEGTELPLKKITRSLSSLVNVLDIGGSGELVRPNIQVPAYVKGDKRNWLDTYSRPPLSPPRKIKGRRSDQGNGQGGSFRGRFGSGGRSKF